MAYPVNSRNAIRKPLRVGCSKIADGKGRRVFGLTPLGTIHTAVSLLALVAGAAALWRDKKINSRMLAAATAPARA